MSDRTGMARPVLHQSVCAPHLGRRRTASHKAGQNYIDLYLRFQACTNMPRVQILSMPHSAPAGSNAPLHVPRSDALRVQEGRQVSGALKPTRRTLGVIPRTFIVSPSMILTSLARRPRSCVVGCAAVGLLRDRKLEDIQPVPKSDLICAHCPWSRSNWTRVPSTKTPMTRSDVDGPDR